MLEAPVITVLVGVLAASVYTDLRFGKIYNKVTVPCVALGIVLGTAAHGMTGLVDSLCGAGLAFALFLFFAPGAGIGGGDVKLMMAVGALTGLEFALWTMLISALIGGIIALGAVMRRRVLSETVRGLAGALYPGAAVGENCGASRIRIPYSAAIALGALVTLLLGRTLGLA